MQQYKDALQKILTTGVNRGDRTGVGTRSIFSHQMRFDLQDGFPAVTTKKLAWKSVVSELLWFLEGSDDERRLAEILHGKDRNELTDKKTIWTGNADKQAVELGYINDPYIKELGPIYGVQWRKWNNDSNDQIADVIHSIKNDPDSRRHIVSAWNVSKLGEMALPPCHMIFQFYVANGKLSCHMFQRSCDMFLGVPFNIASYALLTHMIAQVCELDVGELVITLGDAHIYNNHFDQVNELLSREPRALPTLKLNLDINDIDSFTMDDISLEGYDPHPTIKAEMAV